MPTEKSSGAVTKKPVTPALSSRFRYTKAPLAPRLAGSNSQSPGLSARKDSNSTTAIPGEDLADTTLGSNVTQRSGARLSRTGTDSPRTPGRFRSPSIVDTVSSSPATSGFHSRSTASPALGPQTQTFRRISGSSMSGMKEEDATKFFYAGDVRPTGISSRAAQTTKSAVINAIRNTDHFVGGRTAMSSSTANPNALSESDKFIRANDLPSSQTARARPNMLKQSSSASISSFRANSPIMSRQNSAVSPILSPQRSTRPTQSRPGSPIKNPLACPQSMALPASPSERRNSIGSSSVISRQSTMGGHKKSASVSTVTRPAALASPTLSRLQVPEPCFGAELPSELLSLFPTILASPDSMSPRSASLNSSKTVATSATSELDFSDTGKLTSTVKEFQLDAAKDAITVPPKPSPLSQAQADAANARRERKVLDLEISNSSLLAINKTLERELRKQSAEIRRFRRLSRSGRLSFAPSNRSVSAQSMLSALTEQTEEPEEELDSSDMDEDAESESSRDDDGNLSDTDSITARSRRRAREERRLMLDLSKHQQLLVESQKLSQSIRKCVDLTEELIKDGQRALEYKVGIGDVKLGGRVLSGDEFDEDSTAHTYHDHTGTPRRGLLSPSLTQTEMQKAGVWGGEVSSSDEPSTRLSDPGVLLESFDKLNLIQNEPG